jgi:hypothetical protein
LFCSPSSPNSPFFLVYSSSISLPISAMYAVRASNSQSHRCQISFKSSSPIRWGGSDLHCSEKPAAWLP